MHHWKRIACLLLAAALTLGGCGRGSREEWDSQPEEVHQEESLPEKEREEFASLASERSTFQSHEEQSYFVSDASSDLTLEPSDPELDAVSETASSAVASSTPSAAAPPPSSAPPVSAASSGNDTPSSSPPPASRQEGVAGERTQGDGGTWLGGGNAGSSASPGAALPDGSSYLSAVEQEVIGRINAHRSWLGLAPLQVDARLTTAAQIRSRELCQADMLSHSRPDGRGWQTVLQADVPLSYRMAGENLAMVQHNMRDYDPAWDPDYWFDIWKNSAGHYENMVKEGFTHVGVGIYWVQENGGIRAYATTLFATL